MVNSKNSFWQAFIVTIFVFIAGLVLGFYVELSNVNKSDILLRGSEVDLLDQQIRLASLNNNLNFDCESAKKNIFSFADELYEDVAQYEEKDSQSKFTTEQRKILHKRYDLLRVSLWMEALEIKNKCNENFHTVLYLFDYASSDVEVRSQQRVLSLVLLDLKYEHPDEILLLPIAANLDLSSVDMVKEEYGISSSPALIIDESDVLTSLVTLDDLDGLIFGSKNNTNVIVLRP